MIVNRADGLSALVCLAAALTEGVVLDRTPLSGASSDTSILQLSVATAMCLSLALRRTAPALALLPSLVGIPLLGLKNVDPLLFGLFGFMGVLYSVGAYLERQLAVTCLVTAELAMLTNIVFDGAAVDVAFVQIFVLPPWLAGLALRDRRRRITDLERLTDELQREREARARLAAEAERAHIAREMHDVLAHTIGIITVQAGAGERLADHDPPAAAATFRSIRETGGVALAELRRTLGAVRDRGVADRDDEAPQPPQPGLDSLAELADRARHAGLRVELDVGTNGRPIPPGAELTAYRIVQEAVTNTLRHADAERLDITVRVTDDELRIDVRDDGRGSADSSIAAGHGLVGMRERAALYGGRVHAGPTDDHGYAVQATLALERPPPPNPCRSS